MNNLEGYKYYISLTTVPPRIFLIKKILEDFYINQTIKPYKIIINIPKKYNRFNINDEFNNNIYELSKSIILEKIIIINRCDDFGSATKLLPTLLYFKNNNLYNQHIILIDDDIKYVNDLIETINLLVNNYGSINAYCFTAYNLINKPYRHPHFNYINNISSNDILIKVDIFGGVNGVYLNSNFFCDKIFDIIYSLNFPKSILLADDDFISLYLKKKNIKIYYKKKGTFKEILKESNDITYCLHLDKNQLDRQEQCINYMLDIDII